VIHYNVEKDLYQSLSYIFVNNVIRHSVDTDMRCRVFCLFSYLFTCNSDELEDAAGTPTMPSTITMRVRSTLSLQCNLQSAGGQYYVEWSKDDVQLSQSHKYVITSDSTASSLSISNTGHSVFVFLLLF